MPVLKYAHWIKSRCALGSWDKCVSAFVAASQVATRNPAHELPAEEIVKGLTAKPVNASHQLSAKLKGPKRTLTALLIGMIDRLIHHLNEQLKNLGIPAHLMVVYGDGAPIS